MLVRYIAFAAVALILAACGKKDEQTITLRDPKTGESVDIGVNSAEKGQMTFKSKDGSVVVNAGEGATLPAGFIGYPGAKIVTSMLGNSKNDGAGGLISMTTKDAPATVLAYYKKALAARGMAVKMETTLPNGGMIIAGGDNESDKGAMVTANSEKPGETVVSVVMNSK
jgi:hypothetical protein